ncbi:60S ribosomal protein L18a-like protein [Coffea eugenioides]|uniref:60S ribosomal protein L18a-like protein n=1 Tax=Coffea eugenioides TaxID=49369 RepID=UPI000F60BD20|nr:60S ribosomal protein L18a-like protein [Coffea eugenioides]
MSDDGKESYRSHHHHHISHHHHHHDDEEKQESLPPPPPPPEYGTFQGVANYPPQPVIGFPQPVPPPGASDRPYYAHGYQAVPGHTVAEGTPVTGRQRRLPCCGIGLGWFLFIIGFFLAAIPWYFAAFIILCAKVDPREKPGYITCTVAAILATIAIIVGATKGDW